jgi:CDP-glycerol glycerophosphotransferase (TagB/SpsB family)
MKIDTKNGKHWWLLLQQATLTVLAILLRLVIKKPTKPIVVFYGHQFAGNLKALYIEWQLHNQKDLDLFFLTLDPEQYEILKSEGIQTRACYRWNVVSILARTSIIVTDHGLHAMFPLTRLTNIVFVDVWHSIPFKGFVPRDFKLQHQYDEIWVSSERIKALYSTRFGFDSNRVHSLGYARTDKLFRKEAPELGFRRHFGISPEQKIVLYAPTWQQKADEPPPAPFGLKSHDFIQRLGEICIANGALLVIRCHLNTRIEQESNGDVLHVPQAMYPDTEEILLATDILVCDWSSIAFDFATLYRPTMFLDIPPPFHNGLALGKEYRFGLIVDNMDSLASDLSNCLLDPEMYQRQCAEKQISIVRELYAEESMGRAGRLQVERLIDLSRN